jgi:hypothetical protein
LRSANAQVEYLLRDALRSRDGKGKAEANATASRKPAR